MKQVKISVLACRAGLTGNFDSMNTLLTEALPTAGDLVGLSKNYQTDGTLKLNSFGRLFYKFTLKTGHFKHHNNDQIKLYNNSHKRVAIDTNVM